MITRGRRYFFGSACDSSPVLMIAGFVVPEMVLVRGVLVGREDLLDVVLGDDVAGGRSPVARHEGIAGDTWIPGSRVRRLCRAGIPETFRTVGLAKLARASSRWASAASTSRSE